MCSIFVFANQTNHIYNHFGVGPVTLKVVQLTSQLPKAPIKRVLSSISRSLFGTHYLLRVSGAVEPPFILGFDRLQVEEVWTVRHLRRHGSLLRLPRHVDRFRLVSLPTAAHHRRFWVIKIRSYHFREFLVCSIAIWQSSRLTFCV